MILFVQHSFGGSHVPLCEMVIWQCIHNDGFEQDYGITWRYPSHALCHQHNHFTAEFDAPPRGYMHALIARFMGPTWGPSGAERTQVGLMLVPWTLLSGTVLLYAINIIIPLLNLMLHQGVTCMFIAVTYPNWCQYNDTTSSYQIIWYMTHVPVGVPGESLTDMACIIPTEIYAAQWSDMQTPTEWPAGNVP